jgi:hypothetical protein
VSETNTPNIPNLSASEAAFGRLEEFPSDYVEQARHTLSESRMAEMEAWANGIGAHTERLTRAHQKVGRQIINNVIKHGEFSPDDASAILAEVPKNWRTGVKVDKNGDVRVNSGYPFYGDTPAEGWEKFRSPKNIRKPRS